MFLVSDPIQQTEPVSPDPVVPSAGSTRVRVRYCECDPMGVAHHASYVPWLEMARTELLREGGVSYKALEARGVFLVITRLDVRYRRPIRYDDVLETAVRVSGGSGIKIRHEYEVRLVERDGRSPNPAVDPGVPHDGVCTLATTELACVDGSGRPSRLPGWLAGS